MILEYKFLESQPDLSLNGWEMSTLPAALPTTNLKLWVRKFILNNLNNPHYIVIFLDRFYLL